MYQFQTMYSKKGTWQIKARHNKNKCWVRVVGHEIESTCKKCGEVAIMPIPPQYTHYARITFMGDSVLLSQGEEGFKEYATEANDHAGTIVKKVGGAS